MRSTVLNIFAFFSRDPSALGLARDWLRSGPGGKKLSDLHDQGATNLISPLAVNPARVVGKGTGHCATSYQRYSSSIPMRQRPTIKQYIEHKDIEMPSTPSSSSRKHRI